MKMFWHLHVIKKNWLHVTHYGIYSLNILIPYQNRLIVWLLDVQYFLIWYHFSMFSIQIRSKMDLDLVKMDHTEGNL